MRIGSVFPPTNEPAWRDVTVVHARGASPYATAWSLVRAARTHDALVISGAARFPYRYRDFLAALAIARMRRPPAVVFAEATWDWNSRPLSTRLGGRAVDLRRPIRAVIRALDGQHVTYCVLSQEEADTFPERFGVPRERVVSARYPYTLFTDAEVADDGYVFSGGDARRDYTPLIEAARGLGRSVRIGTRLELGELPGNVDARPVTPDEFIALQSRASVVVVALDASARCSAGQQSFLNAMLQRKPTLVVDAVGVREYVEDGVTAWVVPPRDAAALRERLAWILDPANAAVVARVTEAGRAAVLERFNPEQYWWTLRRAAETTAKALGRG